MIQFVILSGNCEVNIACGFPKSTHARGLAMSLLEQYFSGLIDEKLDRGIRAASWLLASIYVLTISLWRDGPVNVVVAIEATAIVGIVRASYILWMRYVSKSHRFSRLHGLLKKCVDLLEQDRDDDPECQVSMLILRDELAKLKLGLPKTAVASALHGLQSYAEEKRWDMASNMFHIDIYDYAPPDRLQSIALILGKETQRAAAQRWVNQLRRYERHRARIQRYRLATTVGLMSVTVTVVAALSSELVGVRDAVGRDGVDSTVLVATSIVAVVGTLVGATYSWVRGPGFRAMFSKRSSDRTEREGRD